MRESAAFVKARSSRKAIDFVIGWGLAVPAPFGNRALTMYVQDGDGQAAWAGR